MITWDLGPSRSRSPGRRARERAADRRAAGTGRGVRSRRQRGPGPTCARSGAASHRRQPLPDAGPELLHGEAPEHLWNHLAGVVASDGYRLECGPCGRANGYTDYTARVVRVRDDVDPAQAVKTLAHELGHIRADHEHRFPAYARNHTCRGQAEVEAESIAHLVTAQAGLDSASYSVPYVAAWADGDVALLREAASTAVTTARTLFASRLGPIEQHGRANCVASPETGPIAPSGQGVGTELTLSQPLTA